MEPERRSVALTRGGFTFYLLDAQLDYEDDDAEFRHDIRVDEDKGGSGFGHWRVLLAIVEREDG